MKLSREKYMHEIKIDDINQLKVYVVKEKRDLKSGEKIYERIRGYVDIEGSDIGRKWYSIHEKDLEALIRILDIFAGIFDMKIEIEITQDRYPEIYNVLKQYEEKNDDAWIYHFGVPDIFYFLNGIMDGYVDRELKYYGIDADPEKLRGEIEKLWIEITDRIENYIKDRLLISAEIVDVHRGDYNEWIYEIVIDGIKITKFIEHTLDKSGDKYIFRILGLGGSLFIEETSIKVR